MAGAPAMPAPPPITVSGQKSWAVSSTHTAAWLTRLGGHLGPVHFHLGRKTVKPFSVAPWAEEALAPGTPALLRSLRGDFFCLPFGGNGTPWRGERHPLHGEAANAIWRLVSASRHGPRATLQARLDLTVRRGRIDKTIALHDGHAAVYSRHVVSGLRGPMSVGHHAMLKFPPVPGSGVISTSRLDRAQVLPMDFESPERRGYSALRPGAIFHSLRKVPLRGAGFTDLSRYPARRGYEDLVMLTADVRCPFAWTAVTFAAEGYAWFSLRDPRLLRHTVMWISNGGRHYPPWNGRHIDVLGLEDVTAYFACGLAESVRPNALSRRGLPTAVTFDPRRPTEISTIMAVASIPRGFDRVGAIKPAPGGVELVSPGGRRATAALDLAWIRPAPAATA